MVKHVPRNQAPAVSTSFFACIAEYCSYPGAWTSHPEALRLRCDSIPHPSSRRPALWRPCLLPSPIAPTSRRAVFAPTTVSTLVIALKLPAPVVAPSVFLEVPLARPPPMPMPPPPPWSLRLSSRRDEYRSLSLSPWRSLSLCPCSLSLSRSPSLSLPPRCSLWP